MDQFRLYCTMNSTFELCKICAERNKDTRLKPCGHLLCYPCLEGWQKSPGHTCPFCRRAIQGWEAVTIQPFSGDSQDQKHKETLIQVDSGDVPLRAPALPPKPDLSHGRDGDREPPPTRTQEPEAKEPHPGNESLGLE